MFDSVKYRVGRRASLRKVFNLEDVVNFADLCGDNNPLHLDEEFASQTRYKKRIVHGPLVASLFGTIFGTIFPGRGTIYISQTLFFKKPVFLGETVTASVRLVAVQKEKSRGTFVTICQDEKGENIIEGEAQLLLP